MGKFTANQRLLDPQVARETSAAGEVPQDRTTLFTFDTAWEKAKVLQLRKADSAAWAQHWWKLIGSLPAAMRLSPLRVGACLRPPGAPECVGVNSEGRCICYSRAESQSTSIF